MPLKSLNMYMVEGKEHELGGDVDFHQPSNTYILCGKYIIPLL